MAPQRELIKAINWRKSAGRRWTPEEERRLLEMLRAGHEWGVIASELKRTFAGVQNRFRLLKTTREAAAKIAPLISRRSQAPKAEPDLSCGTISLAGDRAIDAVFQELWRTSALSIRKPIASTSTRLALGAIIREATLGRTNTDAGWLRITLKRINARENGISRTSFRKLLIGLTKCGWLERGYLGVLALKAPQGSPGALVFFRGTVRLARLCEKHRISLSDLSTHFPATAVSRLRALDNGMICRRLR